MIYGNYLRDKYNNAAVKLADAKGYPCVFDNSKGRPLKDYKIYGNSIQDGTPTPESPVEVQSVGDLTTKNLLPYPYSDTTKTINGITFTDNGDGTIAASGTATQNVQLRLMNWTTFDKTKKYYISGSPSGGNWNTHGIYISFWLNGTWKKDLLEKGNGLLLDLPNMTVEFNQIQINCAVWNGATVENITFKPQLEEGSTATEYEPYHKYDIPIVVNDTTTHIYLNEPLRKVGDYADYIDFKHQKVVRNIIKHSLSVEGIYRKLNNVIRFNSTPYWDIRQKLDYNMRSTIFRYIPSSWYHDTESIFHHNGVDYLYYWSVYWHRLGLTYDGTNVYRTDDTKQTPLTDSEIINIGKQWLNTLSDKDKEIYMIRSKSTEKTITLPALKTFKGTNIKSVDTNIRPSNIQVQYIKK